MVVLFKMKVLQPRQNNFGVRHALLQEALHVQAGVPLGAVLRGSKGRRRDGAARTRGQRRGGYTRRAVPHHQVVAGGPAAVQAGRAVPRPGVGPGARPGAGGAGAVPAGALRHVDALVLLQGQLVVEEGSGHGLALRHPLGPGEREGGVGHLAR